MSTSLTLSIIIPTKGRKEELIATLNSVREQTRQADEIIVVDQNQPLDSDIERFLKEIKSVNHVFHPVSGLVKNYNKGLSLARSDIVLFLDDDIHADQNLIKNMMEVYEKDTTGLIGGVAGRVLNRVGDLPVGKIKRVGHYNRWTGKVFANFNYDQIADVDFPQGAQMSFRRKPFAQIKGFDEIFDGNAYYFETDAALRLKKMGYLISFRPDCKIDHFMAPRGGARVDKLTHTYYFVKNGVILHRRHGHAYQGIVFYPWLVCYIFMKSTYNLSLRMLGKSLKAILDGLRARPL